MSQPEDIRIAYSMLDQARAMMDANRYEAAMLYAEAAMNLLKLASQKGPVK